MPASCTALPSPSTEAGSPPPSSARRPAWPQPRSGSPEPRPRRAVGPARHPQRRRADHGGGGRPPPELPNRHRRPAPPARLCPYPRSHLIAASLTGACRHSQFASSDGRGLVLRYLAVPRRLGSTRSPRTDPDPDERRVRRHAAAVRGTGSRQPCRRARGVRRHCRYLVSDDASFIHGVTIPGRLRPCGHLNLGLPAVRKFCGRLPAVIARACRYRRQARSTPAASQLAAALGMPMPSVPQYQGQPPLVGSPVSPVCAT